MSDMVTTPARKSRRPKEPEPNTFGHVLWRILGGPDFKIAEVAERLNLKPVLLSAIMQNHYRVSQQMLRDKDIVAKLQTHFPKGWTKSGAEFLVFASFHPDAPKR